MDDQNQTQVNNEETEELTKDVVQETPVDNENDVSNDEDDVNNSDANVDDEEEYGDNIIVINKNVSPLAKWFVINTYSGHENKVALSLKERVEAAALQVKNGEISPIFYFMEKKLMDLTLLSSYTGFWKWTIKRHFKPSVFKNLNDTKLATYAKAFDMSVEELKNFNGQ